jgi:hypothetical protein
VLTIFGIESSVVGAWTQGLGIPAGALTGKSLTKRSIQQFKILLACFSLFVNTLNFKFPEFYFGEAKEIVPRIALWQRQEIVKYFPSNLLALVNAPLFCCYN